MAIHLEQILYIGLGTAVAQNDRRKRNWTSKNNKKKKNKQNTKKQWRIYGQMRCNGGAEMEMATE